MWFLLYLRNSRDLLSLKVFGFSNFKIFVILGLSSFVFGWFVVDRENEINVFKPESSFKTTAVFSLNNEKFTAELNTRFKNQDESEKFLNECKDTSFKVAKKFRV